MALVCAQLSPFLSHTEQLHLLSNYFPLPPDPEGKDDMEFTQFLELVQPFSALRSLYISDRLLWFVLPALQELAGEMATDVLPNLRDLFLERSEIFAFGFTRREVRPPVFTAQQLQQLSGRPTAGKRRSGIGNSVPCALYSSSILCSPAETKSPSGHGQ
jgi:hypothetical protein